uniref:Uncharacterized protein n=1 Tax=Tanacetum cinerariifolium TaxID=118510 RepID=A0A699U7Z2_TANCI|nr:hypothetical protein [Tanacetum cinerariifolium]
MKCQQGKSQSLVTAKADISETNAKVDSEMMKSLNGVCAQHTDPALTRQEMASAHNSSDPAPTCQEKASVQINSDPAPECQTMFKSRT